MAFYKIAELVVEFQNRFDFLTKQCAEYEYTGAASPELTVHVTDEDLRRERNFSPERNYPEGYLESVCACRKLCVELPRYEGLLMHGSVIECRGRGIAFLARSGVGKTTHTLLWKQVYGDQVRIINGDKPIVRFRDGVPYAWGTPWAGKENLQCNRRTPLTDICFLERAPENAVFQIRPEEGLNGVMQQILIPPEPEMAEKTLELLDKLLGSCRIWVIRCNISQDAAKLAHDTILGEKHEAEI